MDVIRLERPNTVESLRDQLQSLLNAGHDDSGFPILRPNSDGDGTRMIGYIGANELEHALGKSSLFPMQTLSEVLNKYLAIVAEKAIELVRFHTHEERGLATSYSYLADEARQAEEDPFDFSVYMDKVYFFRLILWCTGLSNGRRHH